MADATPIGAGILAFFGGAVQSSGRGEGQGAAESALERGEINGFSEQVQVPRFNILHHPNV